MISVMVLIQDPPKLVYDDQGSLVEVVLSAKDFRAYLGSLAEEVDWEALPGFLQDAVDRMLIDEVRDQKEDALDLGAVVAHELQGFRALLPSVTASPEQH